MSLETTSCTITTPSDGIPCAVVNGSHDSRREIWLIVHRQCIRYYIMVSSGAIIDSQLGRRISVIYNSTPIENATNADHKRRWMLLCELVISQASSTMQGTALQQSHSWNTLHDYYETPSYDLQLVVNASGDIEVKIMKEMELGSCFGMKLALTRYMQPAPEDIDVSMLNTRDIIVLENQRSPQALRRPIEVYLKKDSTALYSYKALEGEVHYMHHSVYAYPSMQDFGNYLQLTACVSSLALEYPARVPVIRHIVRDESATAGLLLTYMPGARKFSDMRCSATTSDLQRWYVELKATLHSLQAVSFVRSAYTAWTPSTMQLEDMIYIDRAGDAWLPFEHGCFEQTSDVGTRVQRMEDDLRALAQCFDR